LKGAEAAYLTATDLPLDPAWVASIARSVQQVCEGKVATNWTDEAVDGEGMFRFVISPAQREYILNLDCQSALFLSPADFLTDINSLNIDVRRSPLPRWHSDLSRISDRISYDVRLFCDDNDRNAVNWLASCTTGLSTFDGCTDSAGAEGGWGVCEDALAISDEPWWMSSRN
jgi:hypothetical protein